MTDPQSPQAHPARALRLAALAQAGGVALLLRIAERFYDNAAADPQMAPFFAGIDLERLKIHQAQFLAVIADNDHPLLHEDMRLVHAGLAVPDSVYDRSLAHLRAAMDDEGVPDELAGHLEAAAESFRPSIVGRAG